MQTFKPTNQLSTYQLLNFPTLGAASIQTNKSTFQMFVFSTFQPGDATIYVQLLSACAPVDFRLRSSGDLAQRAAVERVVDTVERCG